VRDGVDGFVTPIRDIEALKEDKVNIKNHLHTLRQWLLQLWEYANLVEKEAKQKVKIIPIRKVKAPAQQLKLAG